MSGRDGQPRVEFEWSGDGRTLACVGKLQSQDPAEDTRRALGGRTNGDRSAATEMSSAVAEMSDEQCSSKSTVCIDVGGIAGFDSSGVALLLHLQAHFAQEGMTVALRSASPRLAGVLDLMQVADVFGLPSGAAPAASSATSVGEVR